jgi:hypothetical protein
MRLVFRNVIVSEDRFHGTFGHARVAIDASVGVDIETIR